MPPTIPVETSAPPCQWRGLIAAIAPHRPLHFALGVLLRFAGPLVVEMLAHAQSQAQLHSPILEIHVQRHQRIALPLHLRAQLANFAFMQHQALWTQGIGIENVSLA